ncbi:4Fe-4S binding protein [Providencia vermicola]|uniref:4Fe-4S binding protein n=1 Tax=Providencia vermicola TaxID=333965 RepID=A0AAX3RVR4_9GAMM|nr:MULTISPECIES: 4Fe-4S binding protein [Providencia]ELX8378195.1 4Fe-4S binding protein [Providencia stuartii]EMD5259011.1 4Fe-4S binding protein [Providencia stuartii]USB36168.1 4Fe-4S binding protein [Providencia vermicola]WFC05000.1 4Fe-4S binding protein [Providencia vermicola]
MRRFIRMELPPEPMINGKCVRKRLKNSVCDSCAQVCPVEAITLGSMSAAIDNQLCYQCGNCLFSCPVDAIDNIDPHERSYHNNRLVISHDGPLASIEELLVWHKQYQINGIEIAEPLVDKWLPVLAALNVKLKHLQEPVWQLVVTEAPEVDSGRRSLFFRQKLDENPLSKGQVRTGLNARKQFYPQDSWFQIELNAESCILCGACAKVCDEQAIKLENNQFIFDEKKCTGCMSCQVVCFPQSIDVKPFVAKDNQARTYHYYDGQCEKCRLSFLAWQPNERLCPICAQHKKQGWL